MSVLIQRPLRGSRISSFYPIKSLPSLASLDSAFQLQEYISLLIRLDVHDVDTIVSVPGKEKEKSEGDEQQDKKSDVTVDEACWIYEQLRRLAQDLTHPLITMLQQECNRSSCPEMKAGEWLYLCVAHGNDGAMEQCCAIDYILHTLDSATALLNSPRAFPSRLQIPQTSNRHFSSLARRLGRIFAHAYFHHREAFEQAEAESSLYARFLALTSKFDLVPAEFLVIPPRMSSLNVDPPRLLGAAVNVEAETKTESEEGKEAGAEPETSSPPGLGAESPRKVGRNRTDTMILSDLYNAEEQPKPDPDTDKLALDLDKTESIHGNEEEEDPLDTPVDFERRGISLSELMSTGSSGDFSFMTGDLSLAPGQNDPSSTSPPDSPTEEMDITAEEDGQPIISPSSSTAPQDDYPDIFQVSQAEEEAVETYDEGQTKASEEVPESTMEEQSPAEKEAPAEEQAPAETQAPAEKQAPAPNEQAMVPVESNAVNTTKPDVETETEPTTASESSTVTIPETTVQDAVAEKEVTEAAPAEPKADTAAEVETA